MKRRTVKRNGKRYVMIDEADFPKPAKKMDADDLPPLPAADADGNMPAIEYMRASIARQLVTERRAAGLTQAELARRAGIRPETLNRLEKAKHSADEATMKRIERALRTVAKSQKVPGTAVIATVKVGGVEIDFDYAAKVMRAFIPVGKETRLEGA
jgi:transcriptional regulator with XRE-family HTH domain